MNIPDPSRRTVPRSLRVLYTDDMHELRLLMRMLLERDGHRVETFADASEACAHLAVAPAPFDLIITDHHMPVMNGLEFVHHLRRQAYPGRIIVFSSELAPEVREAYLALGVDHVLAKPVRPADLNRLLAGMFPATGA